MKYIENRVIKTSANKIIDRMNVLSDNKYNFEYKITDDGIDFISDSWFIFQSEGVKGSESGNSNEGMAYRDKMPPPSAFSRYTSDKSKQFAIAKSVQQKGVKAKNYAKKFSDDMIIQDNMEKIYREFIYQTIDKNIT